MEKGKNTAPTMPNFAALAGLTNIGNKKDSIYLSSLFSGKTEKERKSIRRKIRNSRDSVIAAFNAAPKAQKKSIALQWQEFAKSVYKNVDCIFEANTTDDKAANLAAFVTAVKKVLAE